MNQNSELLAEYEELHKTVIVNDKFRPVRVILPIIVFIMIITVMCVYTVVERNNIVDNIEQVTNQTAEYVAGNIASEMDYAKSSIKFAASSVSQTMTTDTLDNPSEVIAPMVQNTPFGAIEYIRADGMNVMNIGEPFDASDRVYYTEGIKGNTGIWNNYHPKTSKETLMNFYTPIVYNGEISGVLTGYIAATTQIAPLFEKQLYGQDVYGFLVDENNMIICSTFESEYVADLSLDVFMDRFDITEDQKNKVKSIINNATEAAACYKEPNGQGRICVVKIPDTEWKVAIIMPNASINAIANKNTRDSVITIFVISLILLLYAAHVLLSNARRRKEIAVENEKLEEENRIYNEENKRAFRQISEIKDINASANMGTWRIELVDGEAPRMYVDDTMKGLLGVSDRERTPEETYNDWFDNIVPDAVPSVLESVEKMEQGKFDENTYLWVHPTKGERYVRCGGTAQKITGGYSLRGYHYDVDEVVRQDQAKVIMLETALNEKNDYYSTLGTVASIFNSMHIIDLVEDTVVEYSARNEVRNIVNHKNGAIMMMINVMSELTTDDYREKALEHTDLTTLSERMKNKKIISTQLVSKDIGWFLASFITMEADDDGKPTKVIFTTRSINDEKMQEEKLIYKSQTDELTGLLNRRAYEEDIYEHNDIPLEEHFVSVALDVNGLKIVNDTKGHEAGDELLVGASQCMKVALGPYGKLYRTGGDEFIAILFCDDKKVNEILDDFDEVLANWSGKHVDNLTVSYGWVSKEEEPTLSVRQLGEIADKRMYAAKSAHYKKIGVDRRGQQDAHKALCELYTKILKINITEDSYQIVNMDIAEQTEEKGFATKISEWLALFGKSGQVHPDDLDEYLSKTDISYIKEYFSKGKTSLHVFYRRKYDGGFKQVMMEIIPANDYSNDNQTFYLYVKDVDK